MKKLFGFDAPENQAEYCLMCMDRGEDCCPCNSYTDKNCDFPLDSDELENYVFDLMGVNND